MNYRELDGHSIADIKKRFWISLFMTIPIFLLSPMIQDFLGLSRFNFNERMEVLFILSSIVFFYGGHPFLKGMKNEIIHQKKPGMMTLIGLAICTAYVYSSIIVTGLANTMFFWELATLIDIMLLGHWIEMRSKL